MDHLLWEKQEGQFEKAGLKGCFQREREHSRAEFEAKYFLLGSQHEAWGDIWYIEWKSGQGIRYARLVGAAEEPWNIYLPQETHLLWGHFLFNAMCAWWAVLQVGCAPITAWWQGFVSAGERAESTERDPSHYPSWNSRAHWYFNSILCGGLK